MATMTALTDQELKEIRERHQTPGDELGIWQGRKRWDYWEIADKDVGRLLAEVDRLRSLVSQDQR